ncbi:phosphate ABC transporter substrate-binding protein PstS [Demequina capsici]|uniref:Phosphate-binding protein n=1 Tax=Demequina capsici TaxID=3075620 RepID=A0AA96FE47_9MICO|nr:MULTISPECIES: phosphate ABC transporter substrate-binding protein PstS [unclassified Demequina]WNM24943.1 phosphate ABC transporter substrate-binding protein PstS [Demequina sp. OYTSA14]WNM27850.1 phosphate ABC transporter substrate-binding protein PstS [Demequina sp. PMTSA13]
MKIAKRTGAVTAAAVLSLALAACSASNETTDTTTSAASSDTTSEAAMSLSGELNGAGASTQQVAMEAWRAAFQNANPDLTINYDPVGSGGGRTQFLDGSISWAGSDAALSTDEYAQAVTRCAGDTGAINLPVYVSPIAVAFNLSGVDSLNLDAATIAKIFNGDITNWSDDAIASQNAGVTLPDEAITIVHRSDESGTTKNFTDYLAKASDGAWPYDASGDWANDLGESAQGTSGVVQILTSTEGTIGYADESQTSGLGIVSVKVGDTYNAPSAEGAAITLDNSTLAGENGANDLAYDLDRTTTVAGAYPIMLSSYAIVCQQYADATEAANVTSFLEYVASAEGQQAAADAAGSAPISSELSAKIVSILQGIATASGV